MSTFCSFLLILMSNFRRFLLFLMSNLMRKNVSAIETYSAFFFCFESFAITVFR